MRILIIGSGIGGLTAAVALRHHQTNCEIAIYDSVPALRPVGAGLVLAANAVRALDAVGAKDAVIQHGQIFDSFSLLDDAGKPIAVTNHLKIKEQYQTIGSFSIHRATLQQALLGLIPEVPLHLGKKCVDFRCEGGKVRVMFQDGSSDQADLVIAADGIHSVFRQKLVPDSEERYAGYTCWRGVADGYPTASGDFNPKQATETWGRKGRFGVVPLADNRVYWFACVNHPKPHDEALKLYKHKELLEIFGDFHPPISEIIQRTDPAHIIWNDIIDIRPLKRFVFGNIVLLGDAAHATTPNMGQGACQSIEDAVILANLLRRQPSLAEALRLYETRRIPRTTTVINRSRTLGNIAQWQNRFLIWLRNGLFRMLPASVSNKQLDFLFEVKFDE